MKTGIVVDQAKSLKISRLILSRFMHLMFGLPEHVPNVNEKDGNMIENAHE